MPRSLLAAAIVVAVAALGAGPAHAGLETSEDQRIADESVLTIDDVPSVFEVRQPSDDDEPPAGKACRAIRANRDALDEAPNAEVEFDIPSASAGALINNKVAVFEQTRAARAVYRAYSGRTAEACFEATYRDLFSAQLDGSDAEVDVTARRYDPDLGDQAVGYEIEIEASADGETESYFVDLQVVRVGRAIDAFGFFNSSGPPPSDDVVAMTETGVERLEAAL